MTNWQVGPTIATDGAMAVRRELGAKEQTHLIDDPAACDALANANPAYPVTEIVPAAKTVITTIDGHKEAMTLAKMIADGERGKVFGWFVIHYALELEALQDDGCELFLSDNYKCAVAVRDGQVVAAVAKVTI